MSLYIETQGSGSIPLVMLHGWAMHGGIFNLLVEVLREHCTMYLVDLPGHGFSRDCGLPLEPQACARAIAEATPSAIWLGWSLGGLIALQGALDFPQQVRGLAMLCATPRFVSGDDWPQGRDPSLVRQLATDLETDYHATIERFLALEVMGSPDPRGELRKLRAEVFARGEPDLRVLQEGIRLLDETDLRAGLSHLKPHGSWWSAGRLDRLVHPSAMEWSAQASQGEFHVIARAGHAPFLSHADAVAQALRPWLEQNA
ncbi:pimeloyl-ACP methyl ester esterase BioH [Dyella nitratireducens]|uniref:Pimeloyl-[acyl-carrier protein] methyl ester esterase n=1 Tax=Dyella nitratireducens TaxID=1849580 RepID=A0ABQ1GSW4_9GAMM|nr:pimeloyl-ACP methyl ester esterase BioH [Dyella nitratireducens]GGA49418.1 pimeloyl-[acyl-carrier protein] methyl ester esterase [Dyella nitratireducens]GLQ42182.1 pimeloyl-[acyl-carrier protein] methyl ester esterase [Dyella nitratireducens]